MCVCVCVCVCGDWWCEGLQPLPAVPQNPPKQAYGEAKLSLYLPLLNTLQYIPVEPPHPPSLHGVMW